MIPTRNNSTRIVSEGDIHFPCTCPSADYETRWTPKLNDRQLILITECYESTIIFAAREGWVNSQAPKCLRNECEGHNRTSYCFKRKGREGWYWRFRCCRRIQSLLHGSMFLRARLQPRNILEIMWKMSSRTPSTMIPKLIYGRRTSEVYSRISFLRDVVGWWEDFTVIQLGGPGKVVEGDGMFVIGKGNPVWEGTTARSMYTYVQSAGVAKYAES